jgi:hypothetical protein
MLTEINGGYDRRMIGRCTGHNSSLDKMLNMKIIKKKMKKIIQFNEADINGKLMSTAISKNDAIREDHVRISMIISIGFS